MLRSLTSGVSGLKAHQTQMDVIGNNIANVSTTGFKASRVTFKDVYYQTLSGATESDGNVGGTNARQIGFGTSLSTVDVINTRGGIKTTDRALDLYLSGDGYFMMTNEGGTTSSYTRNGNFGFDAKGGLVDANGNYVSGWTPQYAEGTEASPIKIENINEYSDIAIGADGTITGIKDNTTTVLGQIAIAKFPNPEGLSQQDGVYFISTKNSGTATVTTPGSDSTGTIVSGGLEMSNVDLSTELTGMITAERGFQANSRVITVSDEMLQELVNLKR